MGAEAALTYAEYALCDHCMGRVFSRRAGLRGYARLGRKLREAGRYEAPKKCRVCKGVFERLGEHCDEMVRLTSETEFATFLVGATLKPSVLDADDAVRARYALRGTPSAKSDITSTLSKMFARRTGARALQLFPDVTLKVDLRDGAVSVETKPVFVMARYTKEACDLSQKANRCASCSGRGCVRCAYRGTDGAPSVESAIGEVLCDITASRQSRFLWCGSEDSKSEVTGSGRPFFAKLVCPTRRRARLFKTRNLGGGLAVHGARYVDAFPSAAPMFSFTARVRVGLERSVTKADLQELGSIGKSVTDYTTGMRVRTIHSASCTKAGPKEILIELGVDSGFPLRRFVESSTVSPNVTDLLETKCRYIIADFADVELVRRRRIFAKS